MRGAGRDQLLNCYFETMPTYLDEALLWRASDSDNGRAALAHFKTNSLTKQSAGQNITQGAT